MRSGLFFEDCQAANYRFDELETNLKTSNNLKAENIENLLQMLEGTLKNVLDSGELILKDLNSNPQGTSKLYLIPQNKWVIL